jgi:hypothetical protein
VRPCGLRVVYDGSSVCLCANRKRQIEVPGGTTGHIGNPLRPLLRRLIRFRGVQRSGQFTPLRRISAGNYTEPVKRLWRQLPLMSARLQMGSFYRDRLTTLSVESDRARVAGCSGVIGVLGEHWVSKWRAIVFANRGTWSKAADDSA